MQSISRGSS